MGNKNIAIYRGGIESADLDHTIVARLLAIYKDTSIEQITRSVYMHELAMYYKQKVPNGSFSHIRSHSAYFVGLNSRLVS